MTYPAEDCSSPEAVGNFLTEQGIRLWKENKFEPAVDAFRASALAFGNADAMFNLGEAYFKGLGVEGGYDLRMAVYWYDRAFRKRHAGAACRLAAINKNGIGHVRENFTLAAKLYAIASLLDSQYNTDLMELFAVFHNQPGGGNVVFESAKEVFLTKTVTVSRTTFPKPHV